MKIVVVAHPNSKKPRIEKDLTGMLHIYVNQPPLKGKANNAIINALVEYFDINRNSIVLLSGIRSRMKVFRITP